MFDNNPVFIAYAIAASLMILKVMLQGWMTVARMMKAGGGFVNPEDAGFKLDTHHSYKL